MANEDYDAANLEHIIPVKPSGDWGVTAEEAASASQMIGNLTLLSTKKNVAIGNSNFLEKVKVYKDFEYTITNQLEKFGDSFRLAQAKERQI